MKNRIIEDELKREVNSMLPENMVAEIKQENVRIEKPNKNISVIHEKNKKSLIPMIASLVASVVICLAVFLPILIENKQDYNNWLAQQQAQEIENEETSEENVLEFMK